MSSSGLFEKHVVWAEDEGGRYPHHVYGLTVSTAGTVLAFTEARIEPGDEEAHDLVLKRGLPEPDGTIVWGPEILIEDGGLDGRTCWTNPTGLVDRITDRVFFLYALNEGSEHQAWTRVFYRASDDDGRTWSKRREITELFDDARHGWTFHMPGPGHGIQLACQTRESRNGRLLVQHWHRKKVTDRPRGYGVSVIYSDDHGTTWTHGGDGGADLNMNESRLVELADGTVVLNARGSRDGSVDNASSRIVAITQDGGESLQAPRQRDDMPFTGCDSGLIGIGEGDTLLMSHPRALASRMAMTVSISHDAGETWHAHREIDSGGACYSDLALLSDGTVGLLWGEGTPSPGRPLRHSVPARVAFVRFDKQWLEI